MSFSNVQVTGGKIEYKILTLDLFKKDQADYETAKVVIWLNMLNKGQKPKRWNKPNKKGTGVHFTTISGQNEYDVAIGELQGHINVINREHELGLKLNTN